MTTNSRSADPQAVKHIASWLKALTDLMAPGKEPVSAEKMRSNATMLAMDLPTGAFTTESLHFVAQGRSYFPAYDEMRAQLVAWWNERKPQIAPQITDARYDGLTPEEQHWLRYYDRAFARGFDGTSPARVDSLLRAQAPRVWERIHPDRPGVSSETLAPRMRTEWDDEETIYALVHACQGDPRALRLLRAVVARWAPQHIGMVPE